MTARPVARSAKKRRVATKSASKSAEGAPPAALAAEISGIVERALAKGRTDVLPPEAVQSLMSAACRIYAAQIEAGAKYLPLADKSPATATDVMVTSSGLLKAAGLQVFELGMWVSYTGR